MHEARMTTDLRSQVHERDQVPGPRRVEEVRRDSQSFGSAEHGAGDQVIGAERCGHGEVWAALGVGRVVAERLSKRVHGEDAVDFLWRCRNRAR